MMNIVHSRNGKCHTSITDFPGDSLGNIMPCTEKIYSVEDGLLKESLNNELPKPTKNPEFSGGLESLKTYFAANSLSDEGAKKMIFRVHISFLVNCEGKAGNFQIISKGKGVLEVYAHQVLDIVKKMPQSWKTAIKKSDAVDCYQVLSFTVMEGKLDKVSYR